MPRKKTKRKKVTPTRYYDRPFSKLERQLRTKSQVNGQKETP